MISQEKVKGWLVYRSSSMGDDTIETVELSLIPEVWILYIAEYTKPVWDNYTDFLDPEALVEYEISIKEKLNFEEIRQSLDKKEKSDELENIVNRFLNFQNQCLTIWENFCEEYQSLTPEQIQEARKYCVLDSVTAPVVPSAPIEYVLDFAIKNRSGNVWPGVAFLGTISSPIEFMKALKNNCELQEKIMNSLGKNPSGGFEHLTIQDSEKYYSENPSMIGMGVEIPELSDFVNEFNSNCEKSVPMVAPAGSVPAFIQGEWAGIQGSVADVKRDTTLTELRKQTDIHAQMLAEMKEQTKIQKQTARRAGTIAENTKAISREVVERIEKHNGKDYRRYWQMEIQIPSLTPEQIWEWENPGMTLEGLNAEEKDIEMNPIYTSLSRARKKKGKS